MFTYIVTYVFILIGNDIDTVLGNLIGKLPIICHMSDDGEVTTLTPATTLSKSLRTTIPAGIIRQFALRDGDKIKWKMEVVNGELVIIGRPVKSDKRAR